MYISITSPKCKLEKKENKKYGHLPVTQDITITPWKSIDVDCVGSYSIRDKYGKEYVLLAMTMFDPAMRWFEICPMNGVPTAEKTMVAFDNTWLCRYPRPKQVGIDNGSELKGEF